MAHSLPGPSHPSHLLSVHTKVGHLKLPPPRPLQLSRLLLSGRKWIEDGPVLLPASHLPLNHLTRIHPTLHINPILATGHLEWIEDVLSLLLLIFLTKLSN